MEKIDRLLKQWIPVNTIVRKQIRDAIVKALELYKAELVKRDISEHDNTLDILIKVNEQIKTVKQYKQNTNTNG